MASTTTPLASLRASRASLEALATCLEAMEDDFNLISHDFSSFANIGKSWLSTLAQFQQEATQHSTEPQFFQPSDSASSTTTTNTVKVMLASSSKWRRALIASILPQGFELHDTMFSPDIDEKSIRRDDPREMVLAIAHGKMDKTLAELSRLFINRPQHIPHVIVCADQVITFDGTVREKPSSQEQAKKHLMSYGELNIPAICISGVVVCCVSTGERFSAVDIAIQHFKKIPETVADQLIAKGDIMGCAGSFVVEDMLLVPYLGKREGEIESIQGMPATLTKTLLTEAGRAIQDANAKRARITEVGGE